MSNAAYDNLGRGYGQNRHADPRIAARIVGALGDALSVLNVGAGTGSYEPAGLQVQAVEPSAEMIRQRPPGAAPVVQASAESLPFEEGSFDAAMAVLTIHHWTDRRRGVEEMRRVARKRAVLLTFDPDYIQQWWLWEYAPQIAADDVERFPHTDDILKWLGGGTTSTVAVPADCTDLFLGALWARPELILRDEIRASTSGFARMDDEQERASIEKLRADLESGRWDERHGHLRGTKELDVGLRLVLSELSRG